MVSNIEGRDAALSASITSLDIFSFGQGSGARLRVTEDGQVGQGVFVATGADYEVRSVAAVELDQDASGHAVGVGVPFLFCTWTPVQ